MKKLLIILFFLPLGVFAQIPEIIKLKSDSTLEAIVGTLNSKSLFRYNCEKTSVFINNSYYKNCLFSKYNSWQKKQYKKDFKKYGIRHFELAYDFLSLDTIQALVVIQVDTFGKITGIKGIPRNSNASKLVNIKINQKEALEIAIENNFQKGVNQWMVKLSCEFLEDMDKYKEPDEPIDKYYWVIKNTLKEGNELGCNSEGEILYVDAIEGKVMQKKVWINSCVY